MGPQSLMTQMCRSLPSSRFLRPSSRSDRKPYLRHAWSRVAASQLRRKPRQRACNRSAAASIIFKSALRRVPDRLCIVAYTITTYAGRGRPIDNLAQALPPW